MSCDFPILSDEDKTVATAYGVLIPAAGVAHRWTYYIGADGKILAIDKEVKAQTAGADVATKLGALGVAKKK